MANCEGDVLECNGCVVGGFAVFARTQKKEKGNPGHVADGQVVSIAKLSGRVLCFVEDLNWHRFDSVRRGVVVCKGAVERG